MDSEKARSSKTKQKKKEQKMSVNDHLTDENNVISDEELSNKSNSEEKFNWLSQKEKSVEKDLSQEAEERAARALLNTSNSESSNGKFIRLFYFKFTYLFKILKNI